jgi:uncharacterized protein YutE (UPF0331/DUF86 family)
MKEYDNKTCRAKFRNAVVDMYNNWDDEVQNMFYS